MWGAKPKRKRKRTRKASSPARKPLEVPVRGRTTKNAEKVVPVPIDQDTLEAIGLNVARSDTWNEARQHLTTLLRFYLTFQQLSYIVHRIPSFSQRMEAMEMLRGTIRDHESAFYMFSQSFALLEERKAVSAVFGIPLRE